MAGRYNSNWRNQKRDGSGRFSTSAAHSKVRAAAQAAKGGLSPIPGRHFSSPSEALNSPHYKRGDTVSYPGATGGTVHARKSPAPAPRGHQPDNHVQHANEIARLQKQLYALPQGNENRSGAQRAEAERLRRLIAGRRALMQGKSSPDVVGSADGKVPENRTPAQKKRVRMEISNMLSHVERGDAEAKRRLQSRLLQRGDKALATTSPALKKRLQAAGLI